MDGHLDATNMAWLSLDLGDGPLDFLLDTGFQGTVVVGEDVFDTSKANWAGDTEAMLAAGQSWKYDTYLVQTDWLGERVQLEVMVGPGTECLIGTDMLNPHRLGVDYGQRSVHLVPNPDW